MRDAGARLARRNPWMGAIWRSGLALAALAAVGVACNSPTIPIPPLHAPSFQSPADNTWSASGTGAGASAEVVLINRATGDGVVTRADPTGTYATPSFAGRPGDTVELFYRTSANAIAPSV